MNQSFNIGIDIVNVSRFKKKPLKNNQNFYKKIFSDAEINYCKKFSSPYEHFAGKFAIKEALIKSINEKISLREIKTSHKNSKPIVKIKNSLDAIKYSLCIPSGLNLNKQDIEFIVKSIDNIL